MINKADGQITHSRM